MEHNSLHTIHCRGNFIVGTIHRPQFVAKVIHGPIENEWASNETSEVLLLCRMSFLHRMIGFRIQGELKGAKG